MKDSVRAGHSEKHFHHNPCWHNIKWIFNWNHIYKAVQLLRWFMVIAVSLGDFILCHDWSVSNFQEHSLIIVSHFLETQLSVENLINLFPPENTSVKIFTILNSQCEAFIRLSLLWLLQDLSLKRLKKTIPPSSTQPLIVPVDSIVVDFDFLENILKILFKFSGL